MATEDVLDIRGWVHALTDFISENTVGMSRHWEYTDSVSNFLTEFIMAVAAFSGIMGTLPVLLWMERKLPVSYTHLTLPTTRYV